MNDLGKLLVGLGAALIVFGVLYGTDLINLGKLPGDFIWRRGSFTVFFPLGTMLFISLVVSILLALIRRR